MSYYRVKPKELHTGIDGESIIIKHLEINRPARSQAFDHFDSERVQVLGVENAYIETLMRKQQRKRHTINYCHIRYLSTVCQRQNRMRYVHTAIHYGVLCLGTERTNNISYSLYYQDG